MATFLNRALSLLVLIGYFIAAHRLGALGLMVKSAFPLLLATACVWFPDAFGDFSGVIRYHRITTPTPSILVCVVGWIILLGLPPVIWYVATSTRAT